MEVSVIGSSQTKIGRTDLAFRDAGFCANLSPRFFSRKSKICSGQTIRWPHKSAARLTARAAAQLGAVVSNRVAVNSATRKRSHSVDRVQLYVGLPLDAVSDCNTVNHARAIVAGLKALKLLGVDGVELPLWWGIAEKEAMGKYDWSGYLALTEMVQKVGLKLHVSLCFHASTEHKIPLPDWVSRIGESQPDIFFTDRSGQRYRNCLSLATDELPVLDGKTPIQVYKNFCESFKSSFSHLMGSTITGISIGLGPDGELRYPSHQRTTKNGKTLGAGEFQCYDKNMIAQLKQHAETSGNALWGLSGPHDAPSYDQSPNACNFFKDHGGSWETPYGDFFLSWYSSQLVSHGNRLLSLANSVFRDTHVEVLGKVPLLHSWYRTRSHPSELTAGFYNTVNRDGYDEIVGIFAQNSCKMILPGMDLSNEHQPQEALSSPESLLAQITAACKIQRVEVSGQNLSVSGAPNGCEQIKKNVLDESKGVGSFTYQRMGAYFFSPEHFPSFTEFVRGLNQPVLHADDRPRDEAESTDAVHTYSCKDLEMQAA